ncbi:hypothetical protein PseudUWO311_17925 [Pseudanabaena sp. UWO311]|uniref:hypothetical protein n=1 Tax=Pseudanabaena sp. UWO311 TaxID=2487337 RepID=UPI0011590E61|nr:hypothetical protein [Pseudanabaena sp. UWO311]TYQ24764.1 hypothetical protein PseudUWO311_17925 [Pseudanabaena sp. UWO311]
MKRILILIVAILMTSLWSSSGTFDSSDTINRYRVARQLVTEGQIIVSSYGDAESFPMFKDKDTPYSSPYIAVWGPGQSLFFLPFVAVSHLAVKDIPTDPRQKERFLIFLVSVSVFFVSLALNFWLCMKLALILNMQPLIAYMLAVVANFGTIYWSMLKEGQEEVQLSIFVIAALCSFLNWKKFGDNKYICFSAISVASALLFRLTALPFLLGILGLYGAEIFYGSKSQLSQAKSLRSVFLAFGVSIFCVLITIGSYNIFKTGNILRSGNPLSEFSGDWLIGIFEPILGLSRGVVWTNLWILPCLAITIYAWKYLTRNLKQSLLFTLFLFTSSILIYCKYNDWAGGSSYGSRFQVHLLPLIAVTLGAATVLFFREHFPTMLRVTKYRLATLIASVLLLLQIPAISLHMNLEIFQSYRLANGVSKTPRIENVNHVQMRYANFFSKLINDKVVNISDIDLSHLAGNDWERATRWNYLPWLSEGRLSLTAVLWLRGLWVIIVIASIWSWLWVFNKLPI